MKHLKRFNETKNNDELTIYDVLMHMMNIVDDYNVSFIDCLGYDIDASTVTKNTKFTFSNRKYNKIESDFDIQINAEPNPATITYNSYTEICSDMLTIIDYLKEYGWFLKSHSSKQNIVNDELMHNHIHYTFFKPKEDVTEDEGIQSFFNKEQIVDIFSKNSITVKKSDISFNDNYDSYDDYKYQWIEIDEYELDYEVDYDLMYNEIIDKIDIINNQLGADEWEFIHNKNGIKIIFE